MNNKDFSKNKIILYGIVLNFIGSTILGLVGFFSHNIFFISGVIITRAVLMRFGLGFMLALTANTTTMEHSKKKQWTGTRRVKFNAKYIW